MRNYVIGLDFGIGILMMILGTSACHIPSLETEWHVPGVCGVTEDDVIPGCFIYEAGQAYCGEHSDRFVKNRLPLREHRAEAEKRGSSAHKLLGKVEKKISENLLTIPKSVI